MTRKQDLVTAFTIAIREIGLSELKKTSMFARTKDREMVESLPKAA